MFRYLPDYRCLFTTTYDGEEAYELSEKIRAWDKKHKAEIAQYKRLKKKFGGAL